MRIFDDVKSKGIDEFAEWIDSFCTIDNSPWIEWFDKKYCKNCEEVTEVYDSVCERQCSWCEVNNYKCRFFPNMDESPDNTQMIKMWLESEV